jgi:hypothetical protein
MNISTTRSENGIIFQEKQYFDKWMGFFALAGIIIMINVGTLLTIFFVIPGVPRILLILAGIPIFLFVIIGFVFAKMEMTTEVRSDGLYIRYRPTQRIFRHYPFNTIESCEKTKGEIFDWINNWRIRRYPSRTIYQCGSHEKVLIRLTNGKILLLDSQYPDELVTAIASMENR